MDSGGEGGGRWKGKVAERPKLRRPKDAEESTVSNPNRPTSPDVYVEKEDTISPTRSHLPAQCTDAQSKSGSSTLSPFAKEFVPRNHQSSVLSPYAVEFTPSGIVNEYSSTNNEEADYTLDYIPYVDMMPQLIYEVTLNPASFESEIQNLTSSLNSSMVSSDVLQSIAEIIVNRGIEEPNFRYNAARMCKHLSEHLHHTNMRTTVLKACQDVFSRSDEFMLTPEGQASFRGFALFLSEIFSQIQAGGKRLDFIGEKIFSILEKLLGDTTSDNLKCVCQVIKLVGSHLEDQERSSNEQRQAPTIDRIISKIDECAVTIATLDRCIKEMLLSVVELRNSNFGRGDLSPTISTNNRHSSTSSTTDPIRYGPDGQQLTAEEALFLDSICNDVPNGDDFGRYEDNYESEEMDDQMSTKFEEFVRDIPH